MHDSERRMMTNVTADWPSRLWKAHGCAAVTIGEAADGHEAMGSKSSAPIG